MTNRGLNNAERFLRDQRGSNMYKEVYAMRHSGIDVHFIEFLQQNMANADLLDINELGSILELYLPYSKGEEGVLPLAIKKIYNHSIENFSENEEEQFNRFISDEEKVREIFNRKGEVSLQHIRGDFDIDKLTKEDKIFLFIAFQHFLAEELYPGYVLPAKFIAWKAEKDFERPLTEGIMGTVVPLIYFVQIMK